MGVKERLAGIDLFRGLAVYSVVLVHIDEGVQIMPPLWLQITNFALFCVPFFLATAFYLAISKLYNSEGQYPLRSRLVRLLIPYGIWSAFYLLYKAAKYLLTNGQDRLSQLFQDPLSLVFFGGASFHLYFLPLLITGTLLIKLAEVLIRGKISLRGCGLIAVFTLLIYEMVLVSGNGLQVPANVSFEPLLSLVFPEGNSNPFLRWILVELFWVLRCLPYIMFAMFLAHPEGNRLRLKLLSKHYILWIAIFLGFNIFGDLVLPQAVNEIMRGFTALAAAISISSVLKGSPLISNIGACSFGIYLIHMFFVEIFQSAMVRFNPGYVNSISTAALLMASILIFLISWSTTFLALNNKNISKAF
ncbi:acyltransferase [Leptothermofonsia sichuanensis E412]|uniref:acyltransferase family protein n=1 Tax=Leptothermofonsia sichuanensis TaxID=2917832 RepID=UPI001CA71E55|nr:acyltransferase [Leptothermofonsia sichuanensis]QZZ22095.1 acyltransferase [Leptothermofonsia sichuanensis E412]